MYIVEVNMPNLATGVTVEIDGLGFFENGKEHAVSADEAAAYRARRARLRESHGCRAFWPAQTPRACRGLIPIGR